MDTGIYAGCMAMGLIILAVWVLFMATRGESVVNSRGYREYDISFKLSPQGRQFVMVMQLSNPAIDNAILKKMVEDSLRAAGGTWIACQVFPPEYKDGLGTGVVYFLALHRAHAQAIADACDMALESDMLNGE